MIKLRDTCTYRCTYVEEKKNNERMSRLKLVAIIMQEKNIIDCYKPLEQRKIARKIK